MKKFASLALLLSIGGTASAFQTGGSSQLTQQLSQASGLAFSVVADINAEISYIQSGRPSGPVNGCEFCSDEDTVNENDGDVIQHLLRISSSSAEIGRLSQEAAYQYGLQQYQTAAQACSLTKSVLIDIPAARATVFWAPVGIARADTFDRTESKLNRLRTLLPTCF